VLLLEERRLSRKEVATFGKRADVKAAIARLREAFPPSTNEDENATQPVAHADLINAASPH
jgi:hypothetical protein